jgi:hypothetical protein
MMQRASAYKTSLGESERQGPPEGHKQNWNNAIKLALQEVGCACVCWIQLAQDIVLFRDLLNTTIILRFP